MRSLTRGFIRELQSTLEAPVCVDEDRRPWGSVFQVVENCDRGSKRAWSVHVLDVLPGRRFSLHRHWCRDEIFMPISGSGRLQVCDEVFDAVLAKWYAVPRGVFHRISAAGHGIRILELAFGPYDSDDIERLADDYGRQRERDTYAAPV